MTQPKFSILPLLVLGGSALMFCVWSGTVSAQQAKLPTRQSKADEEKEEREERKQPKSARWRVSWGVDVDGANMNATPVLTSIAHLVSMKRPAVLPKKGKPAERYRIHRVGSVEKTVWTIRGSVISVAAEHDGDYRLIVADAKGNKICCVMPDPDLAPIIGRFTKQLEAARLATLKKFAPLSYEPRTVNVPVEVTGLGYFGKLNHDANPSPEGFQLHPLTAVRFPAK